MKKLLFLFCFLMSYQVFFAQEKEYTVACVAFYNLENLFDTINSPDTRDTEFTPNGKRLYGTKIYQEKLDKLSRVVSELGTAITPDGPALLGVAEIENRTVLEDFVKTDKLKARNYQIIHYDSPDKRGIDVGLLYQEKYFKPLSSRPIKINHVKKNGDTLFTRDILYVEGELNQERIHILVNHWPSRRGGERASRPLRNLVADSCKAIVNSLEKEDPDAKVIIMGDLNDDPISPSVKKHLLAKRKKKEVKAGDMYNPYADLYRKGIGSNAYRDAWSLFDQIILSRSFIKKDQDGFQFYKNKIYNKKFLIQKTGQYKGYPFRTYSGDSYAGGYSDHFPVFVYLIKAVE